MDCEKFDRVVLDLLYEELDELTRAAARRHVEHCARCRTILARLRATREVAVLPVVPAPAGLGDRILAAERRARARLPLSRRLGRGVTILASYAMRPQLAMAAVLALVVGSSLLFIRQRQGDTAPVAVIDRGSVAAEPEAPGARGAEAAPAAAAPAPAEVTGTEFDRAMAAYRSQRWQEAEQLFGKLAAGTDAEAAASALYAAQSAHGAGGCAASVTRFEQVRERFPKENVALEATWQAATCQVSLGRGADAVQSYKLLLGTPYESRALEALDRLNGGSRVATRSAARPKAAAGAPAATATSAAGAAAAARPAAPRPAAKAKATADVAAADSY